MLHNFINLGGQIQVIDTFLWEVYNNFPSVCTQRRRLPDTPAELSEPRFLKKPAENLPKVHFFSLAPFHFSWYALTNK